MSLGSYDESSKKNYYDLKFINEFREREKK